MAKRGDQSRAELEYGSTLCLRLEGPMEANFLAFASFLAHG